MPYNDVQFIDVPLGEKDKERAAKWFAELKDPEHLVEELVASGYAVRISWDARNQCYSCNLTPTTKDSVNNGCILVSRSGNWWKAVMSAYFKHKVIMKEDWRPMKRPNSDMTDL